MSLLLMALAVPQAQAAEQELTVAEGTETNDHVPLYDYCYDTPGTISRMVYPADMLSSMSEKTVTKITFYFANRLAFGGGELSVKVGEVNTTAADDVSSSNLTEVWRGSIPTSGATLEFDVEDFVYNGGNLAISFSKSRVLPSRCDSWHRLRACSRLRSITPATTSSTWATMAAS